MERSVLLIKLNEVTVDLSRLVGHLESHASGKPDEAGAPEAGAKAPKTVEAGLRELAEKLGEIASGVPDMAGPPEHGASGKPSYAGAPEKGTVR